MSEQSHKDAAKRSTPASHLSRQEQIQYVITWAENQDQAVIRLFDFCEKILAARNSP